MLCSAHLETFSDEFRGNKKRIYELMELPVYVQINAGSFERWGERRQILKMIRKKEQIFLEVTVMVLIIEFRILRMGAKRLRR